MEPNAFGAAVEVSKIEWSWVTIILENLDVLTGEILTERLLPGLSDYTYQDGSLTVLLPAKAGEARSLKNSVSALLVCKLCDPFVTQQKSFESATFDNPRQITEYNAFLHANLLEIWLYSPSKGTIFFRMKPSNSPE